MNSVLRCRCDGFGDEGRMATKSTRGTRKANPSLRQRIKAAASVRRGPPPHATSTRRPGTRLARARGASGKVAGSVGPSIHSVCGAAGRTEAQVVVPVARRVPVAVRRPAVHRPVVPAAAPVHPVRAPWPLTGILCNTRVRNCQLRVPPAVVNATNAVARCCSSRSSNAPRA